jgi:hypothetical protein
MLLLLLLLHPVLLLLLSREAAIEGLSGLDTGALGGMGWSGSSSVRELDVSYAVREAGGEVWSCSCCHAVDEQGRVSMFHANSCPANGHACWL